MLKLNIEFKFDVLHFHMEACQVQKDYSLFSYLKIGQKLLVNIYFIQICLTTPGFPSLYDFAVAWQLNWKYTDIGIFS